MSLVYNAHIGDPQQKSVLLALADRADDFGLCWPGLDNLVFKTELGRSTVKRARRALIENGWIAQRHRDQNGKSTTNAYRLNIEKLTKAQRKIPQDQQSKEMAELFEEGGQSEPQPKGGGPEWTGEGGQSGPLRGARVDPNTSVHTSLHTSIQETSPVSSKPGDGSPSTEIAIIETREDVEQACTLLADLIEGNGSKRPRISDEWRRSARLLMDKDGRSLEQVLTAIRWCQNDDFWRGNILSMPALRKQYDKLRLAAIRERSQKQAGGRNSDLGTDAHLDRYLERRKAREAEEAEGGLPADLWERALAIGELLGEKAGV